MIPRDSYFTLGPALPAPIPRVSEPPLYDLYVENKSLFDDYMKHQRELAAAQFKKEVKQRQFRHVYKCEPNIPKPTK